MLDRVRDFFVTIPARVLGYFVIFRSDAKWIRKPARREVERMPESIPRLHMVFAEDVVVRRMTIVTCCNRLVARLGPRCIVLAHDMAVRARGRIIRQIRSALRVNERVCTDPERHPEEDHGGRQEPPLHEELLPQLDFDVCKGRIAL